MVDLFYMYAVSGGCASRCDWLNHVSGARELMLQTGSPFQPRMDVATHVRHPSSFHHRLELSPDGENTYTAFDENEPGLMLDLTRRDVELIELPPLSFAKWLMRLLELPARSRLRLLCHDKLFHFQTPGGGFYVSAAASMEELREHLAEMNSEASALCLALDDLLEGFEYAARLLGEAEHLTYRPLHDFIEYKNGAYVYTNPAPLLDLIKELSPASPEAEFLPRPVGCGWNQLHIQIHSASHYDVLSVDKDLIVAWYEDSSGNVMGSRKSRSIPSWGFFCRNGKATQAYVMLKLFAAHEGRMHADDFSPSKAPNVVRTLLRQFLCRQFGYSEDETPIVEEVPKSRVFRTEFSISFADSRSEPLAERRGRARVRLKG